MTDQQTHDQLLPRLTRYLDYFQALTEVAKALTENLKLEEVLAAVMRCLTQLLKPQHWSLLLVDEEKGDLYFEIAVGPAAEAIRAMRLPIGEGIAGWAALHQQAVLVPRVADDPRFSSRMDEATSFRTSSVMAVPLLCRGKLLGVIELVKEAADPAPYQAEDLEILAPLAVFAAIAIDNARTFKHVETLTIIDEWTTLYNARYLQTCLREEVVRADRYSHELSVIFLDLDNFKSINDTRGHNVGSAVLREVGLRLKAAIRETDRAARYGGDEFVIVMPETSKMGALTLAERLRRLFSSTVLPIDRVGDVSVLASFGVASYPADANEAKALLEAADRAMYLAKAKGRNAVIDAATVPQ
jgi:diguanylate cyclase (GGDEF)-like protein